MKIEKPLNFEFPLLWSNTGDIRSKRCNLRPSSNLLENENKTHVWILTKIIPSVRLREKLLQIKFKRHSWLNPGDDTHKVDHGFIKITWHGIVPNEAITTLTLNPKNLEAAREFFINKFNLNSCFLQKQKTRYLLQQIFFVIKSLIKTNKNLKEIQEKSNKNIAIIRE